MQQGLDYAETLNIPFVFASNGDGFVCHDRTGMSAERETSLKKLLPQPERLSLARRPVGALSCLEGPDTRGRGHRLAGLL